MTRSINKWNCLFKKRFGIERIETLEQFKDFMAKTYGIVKADFMKFDYSFPSDDNLI